MTHPNRLLASLPADLLGLLAPHLKTICMTQGQVLARQHEPMEYVYFPHGGIVSYVVEMSDGNMIETGMVGRDGVVGGIQTLDEKVSPNRIMVQVPGNASVIRADEMRKEVANSTALRVLLAKYEQFFIAQAQQSTGCNASHLVEQRMCRWLSRMHDLVGPEMPLTQEFMAQMMGVRRTSVSLVAGQLQAAGFLKYRRGRMFICDVVGLREASCPCYSAVNSHYLKIFNVPMPSWTEDKAVSPFARAAAHAHS